jgi:predicted GTPase
MDKSTKKKENRRKHRHRDKKNEAISIAIIGNPNCGAQHFLTE